MILLNIETPSSCFECPCLQREYILDPYTEEVSDIECYCMVRKYDGTKLSKMDYPPIGIRPEHCPIVTLEPKKVKDGKLCPFCEKQINRYCGYEVAKFCGHCGQAIEW